MRHIKKSNKFFINFLLKRKTNINCKDENGKTVLRVAMDDLQRGKRETDGQYTERKIQGRFLFWKPAYCV